LLELEVGIRETVSAEERSHWVALVPEAVFLHKICAKFACTVAQVQLYERLFRQEFADREVVHRETIVLCQETENAALFQDHQRRWKILVFLCVMFRRQVTERSSLSSDQDTARQSIIDTMRGVAAAKFIKRQQDLQSSWQIRRLRLHADFQDSYISLMREVGFELFFNHALLIAAEENTEYDKMMTYIKAEQEFLSQFLFYGLRLSDGRFDAISHEKNEYNCLRVLDSFPPSAPLIQSGDLVMSVNGVPSVSLKAMRRAISLSRPLAEFTVARGNGRVFTVQVQGTFKLMSRAVSVTSYTAEGYI
jgi:hypothetical protein